MKKFEGISIMCAFDDVQCQSLNGCRMYRPFDDMYVAILNIMLSDWKRNFFVYKYRHRYAPHSVYSDNITNMHFVFSRGIYLFQH